MHLKSIDFVPNRQLACLRSAVTEEGEVHLPKTTHVYIHQPALGQEIIDLTVRMFLSSIFYWATCAEEWNYVFTKLCSDLYSFKQSSFKSSINDKQLTHLITVIRKLIKRVIVKMSTRRWAIHHWPDGKAAHAPRRSHCPYLAQVSSPGSRRSCQLFGRKIR